MPPLPSKLAKVECWDLFSTARGEVLGHNSQGMFLEIAFIVSQTTFRGCHIPH